MCAIIEDLECDWAVILAIGISIYKDKARGYDSGVVRNARLTCGSGGA